MQSFTDFDVLRSGTTRQLTFFIRDPATEALIDINAGSTFDLIDINDDSVLVTEAIGPSGGGSITHTSTGVYQYSLDTATYSNEYMAAMNCVLTDEVIDQNIFVKSVLSKQFAYAATLRVQVDKARKSISDDIQNMDKPTGEPAVQFFYGYDDKHLIYYLERGVQIINMTPPYTYFNLDTYPFGIAGSLLIDGAVIAALESQGIFAIDTDFNYSLGGNSLVIDHFTKLSSMIASTLSRFTTMVVKFKQQYRSKGTVLFQLGPYGPMGVGRMYGALPSSFWSRIWSVGSGQS